MLVCQDDCAVIGYQLFVVMVSVLGLSTQEFVSSKALGTSDYLVLYHDMKAANVTHFRYLGTIITNQNLFQEEIKGRWKLGNAFSHSVQNLLFSPLLSKNVNIRIVKTVIFLVVLCGCETWSLT
jgi:hypothetical protein